ncbi:hypothetical protein [uncultured Thiothrix sp.]|uniref:hypothetical protein n=1 Tax=uncultured Thiothrix sp. TaxID=223185 RepID=UPI0026327DE1|nr:hypothetical protein [uncultured Thiothrix sp.]
MEPISAQRQIVLTGLPRSGTTLTCHLLNKLPDCVALHEPLVPLELTRYSNLDLIKTLYNFFVAQRQQILSTGTGVSKSFGGEVPDNPVAGVDPSTGKRIRLLDGRLVYVKKKIATEFYLVIKQPAFFTAILKDLVTANLFNCFAIVRNPLAVLLSWNSVEMPVSQGRAPAAEAFDINLKANLDRILDIHDRQIFLLDWFFQQYIKYLPMDHILLYEETIKTAGRSLAVINPNAQYLKGFLESKNNNSLYDTKLKVILLEKLLKQHQGAFWAFYNKDYLFNL